jgi:hypothetical protein
MLEKEPTHVAVIAGLNLGWAEQPCILLMIIAVILYAGPALMGRSICSKRPDCNTGTPAKLRALLKDND